MNILEYHDFEVRVEEGNGDVYPVCVIRSPAGEASGTMTIAVASEEWQDRLEFIATARSGKGADGSGLRGGGDSPALQRTRLLGQQLFQELMKGDVLSCFNTSLHQANLDGKGLRLRLRIQAPQLAALPWEYLTDPHQNPLTLSRKTPLVRHMEMPMASPRLKLQPPIRILGMVGYHENLSVEAEQKRMEDAIEHLKSNGMMQLDWIAGHTVRDLQAALRNEVYHVFHFIGHGVFDEESGTGKLLLEPESGQGEPFELDASDLGRMLCDHRPMRLVVLNSCEGAKASQFSLFSSAGSLLASKGVPCVISMQYSISDKAALEFSRTFYDVMSSGMPLEMAVSEARSSIEMSIQGTVEWGTPVLHLRGTDGLLFELDVNGALGLRNGPSASPPATPVRAPKPAAPSAPAAAGGLAILKAKVKKYWIDGVLRKKMEQSGHLTPGHDLMAGAVNNPFRDNSSCFVETTAGSESLGDRTARQVMEECGGSLLILGDPGSGKTVELLELAGELIQNFEADPSLPVPVVYNLSSWVAKRESLLDWMTGELAAKYMIPKGAAQQWLTEGRLIPMLDGLDEVLPAAREQCVDTINQWLPEAMTGTVVCCRFKEYNELSTKLGLNAAIRLRPLTRDQVLTFVQDAGEPLAALRRLLERDSGLLLDARTPLMLALMVRAFQNVDPASADIETDQGLAARRKMVMDAFVNREFQRVREGGSLV